ncbi:unnamed protein product [Prunus armeniaca]|uniref:Clp R domain-containing protein n=1 Tax=Prunus armeniaca TaxID=36596 RepID=A0A6J5XJM6_PRUAR|nr:hypothetical protein GBA52_021394 [Prunus armeniaca]CAB4312673.1 unnamed protein product [Prunus armeniaca]
MPTPVSAARQCLTEDAARALDDAVAVARRRSHAQTTSLHAVSALLALPSSTLRDACARARSSAYSPRLQFRALELSVGVSLDRSPSSKAQDEPPVSNSLMAAIKRSQANQRRHPESFHLHQIHNQQQTASLLKVELKHFILSILDDPIVSRVFGEAGFRSCDIKLAILHPPVTQSTRFPRTRCPPIFLCNLTDADQARPGFSFPFSGLEDGDENIRRIGDVLVRKSGKNPLLIGVCASEALKSFTEAVQKGKTGLLPAEITSFSVVCIEKEISEFVVDGGSEEKMSFKLKEVGQMAERCSGAGTGIIVNYGELKALVGEGVVGESVSFVVMQLKSLLEIYSGKLWLIGAAASDEVYTKLLALFSTIAKDWDLLLLPITSSKASMEGIYSKSSLMGSFVPFGGFFPGPSDFKNPLSSTYQSFRRCHQCTEKYEQEVAAIRKLGSTISAADQCSDSLPSWLQIPELVTGKGVDLEKTKDDQTTLNAKVSALQKKWNDICRQNHHTQPFPKVDCYQTGCQVASARGSRAVVDGKATSGEDSCLNESHSAIQYGCKPMNMQTSFLLKQNLPMQVVSNAENASPQSELLAKDSKGQRLELGSPCCSPYPIHSVNLPTDHTSSLSVTSVTTDLGLGTLYASTSLGPRSPRLQDHKESLGHLSGSISADFDALSENTSQQIAQSSSCSGSDVGGQCDPRDIKSLRRVLKEKVGWQDEAICTISQAVSDWRSGGGRNRGSKLRGDIWLTLIGPDRVGKKKIALALAEILFGTRESLISVDLGSQDRGYQSNSIFQCEGSDDYDLKFRGKTVVDYVAGELSRRPHSVFFLENVDKADFLAQSNLLQAIRTGKFPDSHGREISINNIIFVTTSASKERSKNHYIENEPRKFSEEIILAAKRCQMQIRNLGDVNQSKVVNVRIAPREGTSNPCSVNKRKLIDTNVSIEQSFELQKRPNKALRSFLDLNLPVEETDECIDSEGFDSDSTSENSEAWLEDFLDEVDVKVVLKPFDFDALAEKIVKEINREFKKIFGSEVQLEIDFGVMVQILAAGWLSERKKALKEWIEQVLCRSFDEARQKYCLTGHSVMKLVAGKALSVEEQTPSVCLPARISLN